MISSITFSIFLVFFVDQSSPSPIQVSKNLPGWQELEDNLSAEKVLLPEVERNKTKDEGPDYFYDHGNETDADHLDYNLQHDAEEVCIQDDTISYSSDTWNR